MPRASTIKPLLRLGPKLFGLLWRKLARRARYKRMLSTIPHVRAVALWRGSGPQTFPESLRKDESIILERADAMLRDESLVFTFPYRLRGIEHPWEFDPLEKKYWPRRHYTEQSLHARDTPRDPKIIWEINRFKDLPLLGQAALLTHDRTYRDEALERIRSWIAENPFASTINWASALEISIRLIAWSATIALLDHAGLLQELPEEIARSIFEQAEYLAGDLSTDKVVPTNHLIGEVAGLYLVSSLWDFPSSHRYASLAKRILERELLRQTFGDGVTREASSWYHGFVTEFCDLADRIARATNDSFSTEFRTRLAQMKGFLASMYVGRELVRYGDADDGWALWLEGDSEAWKDEIFGFPKTAVTDSIFYYPKSQVVAAHVAQSFLFLRAGEYGMGGDGYSSHAHDDFLSPVIYLAGAPVLADPGTFVYNGDPENRAKYRTAKAHNGIVIGEETGAVQRMNFGWHKVRPDAKILEAALTDREATVSAQYGEWPHHCRIVKVTPSSALISDRFDSVTPPGTWHLHLAPEWKFIGKEANRSRFQNAAKQTLMIVTNGNFDKIELTSYDFSPSYRVSHPATMIQLSAQKPLGAFSILLTIDSAA